MKRTTMMVLGMGLMVSALSWRAVGAGSERAVALSDLTLVSEHAMARDEAAAMVLAKGSCVMNGNFPNSVMSGNFPNSVMSGNFPDSVMSGNFPTSGAPKHDLTAMMSQRLAVPSPRVDLRS